MIFKVEMGKYVLNMVSFLFYVIGALGKQECGECECDCKLPECFLEGMGPRGPRGYQGPMGYQGPIGDPGKRGPEGIPGEKGITGPIGDQGLQGDDGDDGTQGPPGARGPTGQKGDAGPQGVQGPKGEKGDVGPRGVDGGQGPPGNKGPQGAPCCCCCCCENDSGGCSRSMMVLVTTMQRINFNNDKPKTLQVNCPTGGFAVLGANSKIPAGSEDIIPFGSPTVNADNSNTTCSYIRRTDVSTGMYEVMCQIWCVPYVFPSIPYVSNCLQN